MPTCTRRPIGGCFGRLAFSYLMLAVNPYFFFSRRDRPRCFSYPPAFPRHMFASWFSRGQESAQHESRTSNAIISSQACLRPQEYLLAVVLFDLLFDRVRTSNAHLVLM